MQSKQTLLCEKVFSILSGSKDTSLKLQFVYSQLMWNHNFIRIENENTIRMLLLPYFKNKVSIIIRNKGL